MINKNKLKRIILEEIRKKIILEQEGGEEVVAVEAFSSEEQKAAKIAELERLVQMLEGAEIVTISNEQAMDFATRIYEATKGGFLDLGIGTDETEISNVLKEIPTIVDISYVSEKFETLYEDAWMFTPNLKNVFSEELDQEDMVRHVDSIIDDKMKNDFVQLGEVGRFGYDDFFDLINAGDEIRSQFAGEETSGWVAGSGLISAFDAMTDDDPSTEVFYAPAATATASGALAGASMSPAAMSRLGLRTAQSSIRPDAAALRAAPGTVRSAATAASRSTINRAGAAGAATVVGSGPGMGAQRAAARAAAKRAAAGSARRAAVRAGGKQIAKLTLKGLTRAIPYVGWALLAVDLANWALSANISKNTDIALDSNLYKRLENAIETIPQSLNAEISAIRGIPVAPSEDQDADTRLKDITDLGFGLESPFIEKVIITMNKYAETRGMDDYNPCSGKVWTGRVQECWEKFAPHALTNCDAWGDKYSVDLFPSDAKDWGEMSDIMKSDFPRYTRNPKGCLAFCIDAYYCEIRFGNQTVSSSGGGSGGGGGGSGDGDGGDGGDGDQEKPPPAQRRRTGPDITSMVKVRLNKSQGGSNTFESHGFKMTDGSNPSISFARSLVQNMSNRAKSRGAEEALLNFFMKVEGGRVVDVDRLNFDGGMRNFDKRGRDLEEDLLNVAQDLVLPEDGPYSEAGDSFDTRKGRGKFIKVSISMRAGNYGGFV